MSNQDGNKSVLVVAAHPDDEVLGAGGALLRHQQYGDRISILMLSNGEDARGSGTSDAPKRLRQAEKMAANIGAELNIADFPDNAFDSVPLLDIVKTVETTVETSEPSVIYTHFAHDLNIDHRITQQAVLTAARPQPGSSVEQILSFEVRSSTEWQAGTGHHFVPNYYLDISDLIEKKMELCALYPDEMRTYPHARSIENIRTLAAYRGSEVGFAYAESFQLIRARVA